MTPTWISESLSRIRAARLGVFGDFALEARWEIDAREIGSATRHIVRQRYLLAAAGNIAANLASLSANAVHAVGLLGDDVFGRHTVDLMRERSIKSDGMLRIERDWQTAARGRILLGTREVEHLEFGASNRVSDATLDRLADALDRTAAWCDLIVVHQESAGGICTPGMAERINRIIARHARCRFLVDARSGAELYRGAMLKLGIAEAARVCEQPVPQSSQEAETARRFATQIYQHTRQPVFISMAERGVIVADATGLHENPVRAMDVPLSIENLEDGTAAAIAAVLAGGGEAVTAARFAHLAGRVTAGRLDGPATANPDDIRAVARQH